MHVQYYEQTFTTRSKGNAARMQVLSPGGTVELRLTPLRDGDELRAVMSVKDTVALCCGLLDALQWRPDKRA